MQLSVILVNYRSWKRLNQCLTALEQLNLNYDETQVIIVDNQSGDGQLEIFKNNFKDFIFYENSGNHGFANGCNKGASLASGENLIFLNPDTIVGKEAWIDLVTATSLLSQKLLLSCSQINDHGRDTHPYGYFLQLNTLLPIARSIKKIFQGIGKSIILPSGHMACSPDWISGSLIMISKINFIQLGGWDEDFWMYFEDMDLCNRFRKSGGNIFVLTDTKVIHNHGGASRINPETSALTKAEVMISRHVYIEKYFTGVSKNIAQIYLILNNLMLEPLIFGLAGIILFFQPRAFTYTLRYIRIIKYYFHAWKNKTWISPRSVNFRSIQPRTKF